MLAVHHLGRRDPALRKKKQQRDFRLLQLDQADRPDDPFTLFNRGWANEEMGRSGEAEPIGDSVVLQCHRG